MKQELLNYLKEEPLARERKNKDRACVNLLLRHHHIFRNIPKDILVTFVQEYSSLDRLWRKCLEENKELRGKDYGDKAMLEEKKLTELGYFDK